LRHTNRVDLYTVAEELGRGGRDNVINPLVILCMRCTDGWVMADLQQKCRKVTLFQELLNAKYQKQL